MRLVTTVLIVIAVLLTIPCSIASVDLERYGLGGADFHKKITATGSSPQSVLQFAKDGERGHIEWNQTTFERGKTVYILPTSTPTDQNGYVPLKEFQNATIGIYLYTEPAQSNDFLPNSDYRKPKHVFIATGEEWTDGINSLISIHAIPPQNVIFYDLPIPKHQFPVNTPGIAGSLGAE